MTETTNTDENGAESSKNISTLREMALRGDDYREKMEFEYYGLSGDLYLRPLVDDEFLPIAAFLEDRLDIDPEQAQEKINEAESGTDSIDMAETDEEFIQIMQTAAAMGIDRTQGIAEGESKEDVEMLVSKLQSGKSLIIAERVLDMSSDAENAEKFRRDGGGE